jgi:HD-like signal output (HDOD) protein
MVAVLFADEDLGALDDLRKMCAQRCHDWVPTFVRGGAAALAKMDSTPFDAVVAGGRLVDMDGPAFLRRAKQSKPETVRISLTSAGDAGAAMRSLPVAHQCLSKPFDADVLIQVVERATELQALLNSDATRRMLGQVGDLPSLPANLAALDAALCDENASLGDVAKIVTRDVAMSAKVLQLVNSSFVGLRSTVRDLRQAVAYLGVETLRSLTITTEVFRVFNPSELLVGDWMERFNEHSLEVAEIAGRLVRTSTAQYEASVAGLLHDVGELVVADRAPAKLCEIMFQVSAGRSSDEAETECLGATYPIIGGCLLSLWGMNYRVVEAVTRHRERWEGRQRDPELADAVHVADALTSTGLAPHRYQANSPERPVGDTPEEEGRLGGEAGLGSSVGTTASPGLALVPSEAGPSGAIGLATHKSTELESAEVCEPRHTVDLSDEYLERVGLLGSVRMFRSGNLFP